MNSIVDLRFGMAAVLVTVCHVVWPLSLRAAEPDTANQTPPVVSPTGTAAESVAAPVSNTNLTAATSAAADLRAAQEAIEQLRKEIESSTARNAEAITAGLGLIEPTLARMHERQMEAVQSSNRTILLVAGIFAAVGFVGLIFISLILVRAIGRFSEIAVVGTPRALLAGGHGLPALGEGEMLPARGGAVERATGRFQGAIDQLQQRIQELERGLQNATDHVITAPAPTPALPPPPSRPGLLEAGSMHSNIQPLPGPPAAQAIAGPVDSAPANARVSVLLGKGQALLNLDSAEQALECFEEALQLEPTNADGMVKKGMALEKLQDWERALEQYNRAIAIDPGITVAYLYRGGVYNRLQRYREALESYEDALRTEKKSKAS